MTPSRFVTALAVWFLATPFPCPGEDWPHFLGARYDLHCEETGLQLQFPEEGPKRLWEFERGRGHAGPVVVGDRVVFIHQIEDKEEVCCLDAATGERLWDHSYPVEVSQSYGIVDAPRSSPVADPASGLVFTFGNDGDLICFRLESGEIVWQCSVPETFGEGPFFFGYGSSPLVHGEKLIVNAGSENACIVALDKLTGRVIWQSDHAWHGSYASPIVAPLNGADRVLVFTGGMVRPPTGGLLCVNPENGRIESEFSWRSDNFASVNAASPVYCGENRVFISEDYGLGGVMLRFGPDNQPSVLWTSPDLGCQLQTPVYHQGTLYGVGGGGGLMMACDVRTGRSFWSEMFYQTTIPWQDRAIPISLGRAHLLHVDGGFLCLSENGALIRLNLNPGGFEIIAKTRPFYAPESWAPPVISGGRLYVMQNELGGKLHCFDLRP